MLSSISIALCIALSFLACSLPQDSLNSSQQVAQQKRIHQDVNVSLEKLDFITDVQFSPDGTLLAIATDIGILLYDTKTYDNPEILSGHTGKIWSIAFRPDGKVLASAGQDKTVRLWDMNTRQQIKTFGINLYPSANIVFSPDGKMIASGGASDGIDNAYLWDADTGICLRTFSERAISGRKLYVMEVAFSPDGKMLASTGGEQTTRLWDVNTGQLIRSLTGPIIIPSEQRRIPSGQSRQVHAVAFSPDGNMLVSDGSSHRGSIDLWDVNTGKQIRILTIDAHLEQQITEQQTTSLSGVNRWTIIGGEDVAFSPDGNTIACTGTNSIHLWDADSGQYHRMLHNAQVPFSPVNALAFSPDGKTIACSGSRVVAVWDVKTEELIRVLIDITSHR